jgi:caffeoyl-CoA O-methyltransferase
MRGMTPPVTDVLDAYIDAHTTPLEPLLQELHEATYASVSSPGMIAGPVLGQLLRFLAAMTAPRLALEIGTFTGYSALAIAGGMPAGGRLITCEVSEERAEFARSWFRRSPYGERIDLRVGPALETVARLDGPFDLVFIDADKSGYPAYYDAVVPKLSARGIVVVDNTLRGGDVAAPRDDGDREMAAFNERVQADPRTENVLLTVRDGVTLIRLRGGVPGERAPTAKPLVDWPPEAGPQVVSP